MAAAVDYAQRVCVLALSATAGSKMVVAQACVLVAMAFQGVSNEY